LLVEAEGKVAGLLHCPRVGGLAVTPLRVYLAAVEAGWALARNRSLAPSENEPVPRNV
jgi:hypothetical protein